MDKLLFDKLMKATGAAVDHAKGKPVTEMREYRVKVPKTMNVRAVRKKLGMTQQEFSSMFGFSLQAVKFWETGKREPEAAAKVLLRTIAKYPEAVLAANR